MHNKNGYEHKGNRDLNLPNRQKRLQHLKKRRKFRTTQIWLARGRNMLKILSIIFLFWLLGKFFTLSFWYLPAGIFNKYPNKYLKIEGTSLLSTPQILSALKKVKYKSQPVYLIDTRGFEKALEKLPPVRKVYIRRFWMPARMEVVVDEKTPIISLAPGPNAHEIAMIADDGSVIGREYISPNKTQTGLYKVLTYDDFFKWNKRQIKYLVVLAKNLETYSGESLTYLDMRVPDNTFAQMETVKIRMGELGPTLKNRIKRIVSIMPQIEDIKYKIDFIDLSWDKSAYIKLKDTTQYKIEQKQ